MTLLDVLLLWLLASVVLSMAWAAVCGPADLDDGDYPEDWPQS